MNMTSHGEITCSCFSGIDVLRKKSELQREFSKRKEKGKEKEVERRNSFETRLQEMADKMRKVK